MMDDMDEATTTAFLTDLAALCGRYGVYVEACNCCESINIMSANGTTVATKVRRQADGAYQAAFGGTYEQGRPVVVGVPYE